MSKTYKLAMDFKRKYPSTIAWRIKSHCDVIDKHLDSDEDILYVFLGQKNRSSFDFMNTNVVALTSKRLMVATKRLAFGYFFKSITLDMFNDLSVKQNLLWGRVIVDTVNEKICLSNVSKKALGEIETKITDFTVKNDKKKKEKVSKKK